MTCCKLLWKLSTNLSDILCNECLVLSKRPCQSLLLIYCGEFISEGCSHNLNPFGSRTQAIHNIYVFNFLLQCMRSYVEFEVCNGAYEVSCPDARCRLGAALSLDEISLLLEPPLMEKHMKFRLNHGQYYYNRE